MMPLLLGILLLHVSDRIRMISDDIGPSCSPNAEDALLLAYWRSLYSVFEYSQKNSARLIDLRKR
jgi:hypothetical protein